MSTDELVMSESVDAVSFQPYDQFILFGDSITQFSVSQEGEFGFNSALQDGQ